MPAKRLTSLKAHTLYTQDQQQPTLACYSAVQRTGPVLKEPQPCKPSALFQLTITAVQNRPRQLEAMRVPPPLLTSHWLLRHGVDEPLVAGGSRGSGVMGLQQLVGCITLSLLGCLPPRPAATAQTHKHTHALRCCCGKTSHVYTGTSTDIILVGSALPST